MNGLSDKAMKQMVRLLLSKVGFNSLSALIEK
jgi:hypothetical protein